MKVKLDETDSKVIKSNETYDVIDNTNLNKLIVSKTILHPGKETGGHNHKGQEEVYIFMRGSGSMIVGEKTYSVKAGSIVLIPDGAFHKVWNLNEEDAGFQYPISDLEFICVFDGGRNH
tara:strand:- start:728 stop:1084 length:357 start_codon:yes stop_codon:yes gene_type:complete